MPTCIGLESSTAVNYMFHLLNEMPVHLFVWLHSLGEHWLCVLPLETSEFGEIYLTCLKVDLGGDPNPFIRILYCWFVSSWADGFSNGSSFNHTPITHDLVSMCF